MYTQLLRLPDATFNFSPTFVDAGEGDDKLNQLDALLTYFSPLSTCHQLHHEVNYIFFELNCFKLWLNQDLSGLPETFVQRMKNFELFRWGLHLMNGWKY